jgi:hypothetical protein
MTQAERARTPRSWAWLLVLILLVAFRIPSIVQPAGGDQWLYSYVADRVLDGDVPYRDAFEQKPPGVFGVYALMWGAWPRESAIAGADLVAAALVAWLLVGLGRTLFGGRVGEGAAALFLLLGDPAIQRLGGLNVRAQCETFIALAVTGALVLAVQGAEAKGSRSAMRLLIAGVLCGLAFWLKYNAVVYLVPVAIAATRTTGGSAASRYLRPFAWLGTGAAAAVALGLVYFASRDALVDLWLGTVGYNLAYSGETYRGAWHMLQYPVAMLIERAFVDGLWFAGELGGLILLLAVGRPFGPRVTVLAWLAAVVASIAINGSRGLPQYFVQAAPALAVAGAAGLATLWRTRTSFVGARAALPVGVLLVIGLWRVGIEPTRPWVPRLFGLPQAVSNAAFDLKYATGGVERSEYLTRFGRGDAGKFSPLLVEQLAYFAREQVQAHEAIYVFGFASGGVYVKSGRRSASRFFWSRPVVLEFEGHRPGYGSTGLLADLQKNRPAIVALQKQDWGLAEANVMNSRDFFMSRPALRSWLEGAYVPDYEDAAFAVWRRKD